MSFNIKRLFSDTNIIETLPKKTVYIKSSSDYIANKFLNILSTQLYSKKTDTIFFYNTFKDNYLESIYMPNINLYISSLNNFNPQHTINLDSAFKYFDNFINCNKYNIENIKYDFYLSKSKINSLFLKISKQLSLKLDYSYFNDFKNHFIESIFKSCSTNSNNLKITKYFVSSVGINGFKTFSNYIPHNENKIFIMNDEFNVFTSHLFQDIISKADFLKISYVIYKNTLNPNIIDHIKIPSLNLCLLSNNFLFKSNIPGIQINAENLFKYIYEDILLTDKLNLNKELETLTFLCENLNSHYLKINSIYENNLLSSNFDILINETLKIIN